MMLFHRGQDLVERQRRERRIVKRIFRRGYREQIWDQSGMLVNTSEKMEPACAQVQFLFSIRQEVPCGERVGGGIPPAYP